MKKNTNENILAIDIGGSTIKYAISTTTGDLIKKGNFPTPTSIEKMYEEFEKIFNSNKPLQGIALSTPGSVDNKTGKISGSSAINYLHTHFIKNDLEHKFRTKISIENDANCAALAEIWKGEAQNVEDCCLVVCGTGIGGAVVKGRKIHHGKNFHGGEFGYLILGLDEKEEPLMWSNIGSTRNTIERVAKEIGKNVNDLDGKEIFDNVDNNPVFKKHVDMFYKFMSIGIYNIQYVFDPEIIIVGGAISKRRDLIENIYKFVDEYIKKLQVPKIIPIIKVCKFGNDSNLIGAVYNFLYSS